MKVLIILLTFLAFSSAINPAKSLEERARRASERQVSRSKNAQDCSREANFDFGNGMKLLFGDFSDKSDKAKCFLRCLYRKEGFFNKNDEPLQDVIVDTLSDTVRVDRDSLKGIVRRCSTVDGVKESCESAYHLLECILTDKLIKRKE